MMHAWVATQMARGRQQQVAEMAAAARRQGGRNGAANPLVTWYRRSGRVASERAAETGHIWLRSGLARS